MMRRRELSFGGSSVSSFCFTDRSEEVQSEMGKKRSFRELASGSACASEPIAPPITTSVAPRTAPAPSTAPALAPSTISMPSSTPAPSTAPALAPSTTSTVKSVVRMPPSVVLGMPASDSRVSRSSIPLPACRSREDARKKAKGNAHETATSDHRRSEPLGDDERESKRTRTDLASPTVRVSQPIFDDDAAVARLFATVFLAFVNRVGHELEAEIKKQRRRADNHANGKLATRTERNKFAELLDKRNKELEKALGYSARLRCKNEKLTKELETAIQDASYLLTFLSRCKKQIDELKKQVEQKRKLLKIARALIVDLHEKFAIAKAKFAELKGDSQEKMIFQVQREANLDFVKQLLGLLLER
ncbi:hypothetical protein AALP_AA2G046700 [Arabis alpina]|uniref:Uncharacterized protein n=1 Tax=Arabis alpina TaxID=50452 RepID=A0A087HFC6_ARAAL|nr:hypothetical protein AALP_AA2G046700 [Arabis alpina]